jgi:uncharacterized protein (TIGR02266 family)
MADAKGGNDLERRLAAQGGRPSKPYATIDSASIRAQAQPRDPRIPVVAQVRLHYNSILDFHESQSLNISRTGMFLASENPGAIGSLIDFEFGLADGFSILRGKGEVVRVTQSPVKGMGVRFREMDEESRRCLERIVATNEEEGRTPKIPLDFGEDRSNESKPTKARSSHPLRGATQLQPGLAIVGKDLQVRLTPLTVGYFTNNPLINIRLGGFVIPIEEEVPLGAIFEVTIMDNDGLSLFRGKGKVVAKDEHRIGLRLSDVEKTTLARLQAEVARLSPGGK